MAALQELLDEQARIKNELQRMENDEETTEEKDGDLRDTLVLRWEELDEKTKPLIERMERIKAITRVAQDEGNLERPDGPGGGIVTSGNGRRGVDLVTSRFRDPYDCQDAIRHERQVLMTRGELKGRALDAVELEAKRGNMPHDYAEAATEKAQGNAGIARHMLLYGSQEYQDAFRAYTEDPEHVSEAHRAALTLSSGSVMLPFVLDPTIVLTNGASANPWRRISNVKQTTSNTWNGVNSAGVNAAWLAEATITTDNTPTLAAITVTPQKAAAWVYGSYELLEDSDFGQQLPTLLADAKDRLEEAAFATGGGGTVPNGVVPGATTVVTTATTTVIALGDIYATQAALPARFRNAPGAAWVANVAIINKIRQLDTAGGSSFWTNLGKGQPETLLGAPIYESTTMDGTVAVNALEAIFGDFGSYIIVDRVGVSMIYEPLVKQTGGIIPGGQAGWFMFWRVGAQLSTVNAFRVMKGK
jgi:HK97 family phage major capsid protein